MIRNACVSILVAAVCLGARPAAAGFPVPSPCSTCPTGGFVVVGSNSGQPDVLGTFCVVVRTFDCVPIPGSSVAVLFTDCPGLELCADPLDPGAIVSCAQRYVLKVADQSGMACFRILGRARPGFCASWRYNCARIYADGVLLCSPSVAAFDLDGRPGLSAGDLSSWLDDYFCGASLSRSDYDHNGQVGAADLALWADAYLAAGSIENCAVTCP